MATCDLEWLGTWYGQQCNGKWEHQKGMRLEPMTDAAAVDRPAGGWRLSIDLRGTAAAGSAPRRLAVCAMHGAWLRCSLTEQKFQGEGAEVEALIGVFRQWIDARPPAFEAASAG